MSFGKELTKYIDLLNCSTNDICKESGISYSLINRYINDKRTPKEDSDNFNKVVNAIYTISTHNKVNISKNTIYNTLKKSISNNSSIDFDLFIDNLNILQDSLGITTVELAKAIGYDSSFVSRIKNKERKPAELDTFIEKTTHYFAFILSQNEEKRHNAANIFNCKEKDLENFENFNKIFSEWSCLKHVAPSSNNVLNFLSKLDTFNLNDYVGTDFSKIKVPTTPVILKNSKTFYGIEGRKQAEGEFLKITLLSKSDEPIFFYSDLPMCMAGADEDFKKKWIFVMTRLLKRGLHLNMVHNLNRPIEELLLGLECWIPMYMTGLITPYYFKTPPSNFFYCSHCTSGSVALHSECIKYNEKKSRFFLTTKKDEVEFEKEKSKYMLSKATPLIDIYQEGDQNSFDAFMKKENLKNVKEVKKDIFKNIDFIINNNKWVIINKKTSPEIHFVIHHEKLITAIKTFLLSE